MSEDMEIERSLDITVDAIENMEKMGCSHKEIEDAIENILTAVANNEYLVVSCASGARVEIMPGDNGPTIRYTNNPINEKTEAPKPGQYPPPPPRKRRRRPPIMEQSLYDLIKEVMEKD